MNAQSTGDFRWLSPLGISVGLLLGYGILNTLVGIVVPFLTRRTGTAGFAPLPTMDLVNMLWLAFGIFQLGLVWFGVREKQVWAFAVVIVADIAQLVGWLAYGWQTRDFTAPLLWYDAIFLIPAIVLGWFGLR